MKNLSKITLFIISVSTMRTEKRKQDEILSRDKHATIVGNCLLKLQDTANRRTRVKEKSQLPSPLIKDLLIAKNILKSFDF